MRIRLYSLFLYLLMKINVQKWQAPFFLSPQLPLEWIIQLSDLNPTAFKMGIIVAYLTILNKSDEIRLTSKKLREFSISTDQKRRALRDLEEAGLVSSAKLHGKNPIVRVVFNVGQSQSN